MRKLLRATICILMTVVLSPVISGGQLSAYFSGVDNISGTVNIGSVGISLENLSLTDDPAVWSAHEGTINNGILRANSADIFSFDITNRGKSAAEYFLDLEFAWDADISESGKLYIYSDFMDDETILYNIQNGITEGEIVGASVSDNNSIILSTGERKGVSLTVDYAVLDGITQTGGSPAVKSYGYKLFFYESPEVATNPAFFHNRTIEVVLTVRSALYGKAPNWSAEQSEFFRVSSVIESGYPVIREISHPKTFFLTQTGGIDLSAYAVATDVIDGDITPQIEISSSPAFDPQTAGLYTVTYNVTNSQGNAAVPMQIQILIWDFVKLASGNYHTLALTSHGKVYAWGYNVYGQLGDGTTGDKSVPQLVGNLDNVIDIAAGAGSSYALTSDGQAYAWGRNDNGRLGDNTVTTRTKPVKVLQSAGVVFKQIESRFGTAAGVTPEGDVYTWGYGGYGAAGTGADGDRHIPTKINLSGIESVALGYYNGAAITADGRLYTWGDNLHGQLGNGVTGGTTVAPALVSSFDSGGVKISNISVGWYHMAAVSDAGQLYTWGYGAEGRLGNGAATDRNTPQAISLPDRVRAAETGYYHTGIITDGGAVYFCGQNAFGKHGSGNATNHTTPYLLNAPGSATAVSLALDSSFVLSGGTAVYGMGYGGTGVLGTGNNANSTTPAIWAFSPPPPY